MPVMLENTTLHTALNSFRVVLVLQASLRGKQFLNRIVEKTNKYDDILYPHSRLANRKAICKH